MPAKEIIRDEAAQQALLHGIDTVANAVKLTLGPKGRNVVLEKKWGAPVITNDGVTIAKEIDLPESFENMGAQLIKEAAAKTNEVAGDGTTTATILAQIIIQEGIKNVVAGADPMAIKRGIDKSVAVIVAELRKNSNDIKGRDQMAQVATVSANNEDIGNMLADVSGDEVEAYMLANNIVEDTDREADAPTDQPCENEMGESEIKFR